MTYPDPAERMARVRAELAKQNAKRGRVDSNGKPLPAVPSTDDEVPAPAAPVRRLPAPNPAIGSSADGAPDYNPDDIAALTGHGRARPEVLRLRGLLHDDEQQREQQRRAGHERARVEQAALSYQQRR
jgi:hypothetical protein